MVLGMATLPDRNMRPLRVIVAEDKFFGDTLAKSLTSYGVEVIGWARTIQDLFDLVAADPPDVVIQDIRMPHGPHAEPDDIGLDAAMQIRLEHPDVAILVLSHYDEWVEHVVDFDHSAGYLLKDKVRNLDLFVEVLLRVADGELYIDQDLANQALRDRPSRTVDQPFSRAEFTVLRLMAQGLSNSAIARRLHNVADTIEAHTHEIYRKLGLPPDDKTTNRRVLASIALRICRHGLAVELESLAQPAKPRVVVQAERRRWALRIELIAFRLISEAVDNAQRFARASEITVQVRSVGSATRGIRLRFDVSDDGTEDAQFLGRGPSVLGMKDRAVALGGTLEFERGRGGATRIWAELPDPRTA